MLNNFVKSKSLLNLNSYITYRWDVNANSIECVNACKGHERSVDCVAIDNSKSLLASGSYDTHLKIWDANLQHASNRVSTYLNVYLYLCQNFIHIPYVAAFIINILFQNREMMMVLNQIENVPNHLVTLVSI